MRDCVITRLYVAVLTIYYENIPYILFSEARTKREAVKVIMRKYSKNKHLNQTMKDYKTYEDLVKMLNERGYFVAATRCPLRRGRAVE